MMKPHMTGGCLGLFRAVSYWADLLLESIPHKIYPHHSWISTYFNDIRSLTVGGDRSNITSHFRWRQVGFWGHLQSKGFRAKSIEHSKIQIGPLTLVNELITSDAACQDIDWAKNPMKPDTLKSYIVGDSSISTIRSL